MKPFNTLFHTDIDECSDQTDSCDDNADCNNVDGSYNCACIDGFDGDGLSCSGNFDE